MLVMSYENFVQNNALLFKEILNRGEIGIIEISGLGRFRVSYEPDEAANDNTIERHPESN